MYYCIKCGYESKKEFEKCKKCGEPFVSELNHDSARSLVQRLHANENKSHENVDAAMVFIVLGSIFLIIGLLFFFLSFKLIDVNDVNKSLSFTCFEFYVSMAGLGGGGFLLIWGIVRLVINELKLSRLKDKIIDVRDAYLEN